MPTYEYRCATCGIEFETIQSMSEAPLGHCLKEVCPLEEGKKGTGTVERRISAGSGLVFKGSGFYITDYKHSGEGKKDVAVSPASSTSSKKDSHKDTPASSPTPSPSPAPAPSPTPTAKGSSDPPSH